MYVPIQEPLLNVHKYYLDGYYTHKFSEKKSSKINELIQEIMGGNIRKGFSLVSKYPETADLRPFAADYDEEILDFLIKTGAYDILRKLTGQDLYLYHAQLRITSPSSNLNEKESYMDWHRDSYYKSGKRIGFFPPVHKIMFYPDFEKKEDALRLIPGSQKADLHADQSYQDSLNNFDKYLIQNMEEERIPYSNDQVVIFNTASLHAAAVNQEFNRARLIYSFLTKDQIETVEEQHKNLSKTFHNKVA